VLGPDRRAPHGAGKKSDDALAAGSTEDPILAAIFIAQKINRALGTTIGPWDVDQLDDALIGAIERLTRPRKTHIPDAPEIERRKAEIRAAHEAAIKHSRR
jgi:hypothetical protein